MHINFQNDHKLLQGLCPTESYVSSQYEKKSFSVNTIVQKMCRWEWRNFSFHEQVSNFMFHYEG